MLDSVNQNIADALEYRTYVMEDTISETKENYSLEGKIAPRFHNEGTTDVQILNVRVRPGEMFNLSATAIPMSGTIPLLLPSGGGKLIVVYNTLIKHKKC